MTLTIASFKPTRGVGVFKCVYKQTSDILSNYYNIIYVYLAMWHEFFFKFLSNTWYDTVSLS